jgi:hypothetical protein
LTGVEAVSNGVQALRPPEGRNAARVMTVLGVLSIAMFLGITCLAYDFGIVPGGDVRPFLDYVDALQARNPGARCCSAGTPW